MIKYQLKRIFRIKREKTVHIKSKQYHINTIYEAFESTRFRSKIFRKIIIKLTPIKNSEVPMSVMLSTKNLDVINIEIED